MLNIPIIRWGESYESLEIDEVLHFSTGEPIARVSQTNGGIISRDMKKARNARKVLKDFTCEQLLEKMNTVADLYENATLPLGDGTQSPDDFVHQQSASTGLPEHMCRGNMGKNSFVLRNMTKILDCLTRGRESIRSGSRLSRSRWDWY